MKALLPVLLLAILSTPATQAHPGRTAADGCHYCRTNCDRWGERWNERHCHKKGSNATTGEDSHPERRLIGEKARQELVVASEPAEAAAPSLD